MRRSVLIGLFVGFCIATLVAVIVNITASECTLTEVREVDVRRDTKFGSGGYKMRYRACADEKGIVDATGE